MLRYAPRLLRTASLISPIAASLLFGAPAQAKPEIDDLGLSSLAGTYLAARTADVEKDVSSAAEFYRMALKSDPENLFLLERALILTAADGDVPRAVEFAKTLKDKSPTSHVARLVLGIDDIREGKYDAAIKNLGDSGAGVLADLTDALLIAWARFGQGEVEQGLTDLDKLQGEDWYEPFKLLHEGYIGLSAGRTEEALKALGAARVRDPNAVRITEAYARALAVAGRKDEAEAALQDFLTRFPDNALAIAALDDVKTGKAHVDTVSTPKEGASEALAGIGAAVGQEGGTEVAFLYLRLALYLDPNIAGGLGAVSLGNLLDVSGQGEAAINVYDSVAADAPFRGVGQLRAALALDRMDKTEAAEKAFKEAIAKSPKDIQTYMSYGNMLRGRERFADAAKVYSEAVDLIPTPGPADWSLFYFRGIAYERTKEWTKAEADFKEALKLSPDQPLVMNYLGYSWVDMGMNLDEAMAMIRKAVDLRPNDGYIVDSLGWAHYRLGEFDQAVTELERAVSLRPDDPTINDHLGDAYWQVGRKLEAQFQWRHARDFGAKPPDLDIILKKIAEGRLVKAAAAEPQQSDDPVQQAALYTVRPGDSLWTISASLLKSSDAYDRLIELNRDQLRNPDLIYPGMQLRIPGRI